MQEFFFARKNFFGDVYGKNILLKNFVDAEIVVNNLASFIPTDDKFIFGILTSKVHMAWLKKFCGRLKSDLSYSATIIYNTFPFPEEEKNIREKISATAGKNFVGEKKFS